MFITRLLYPLPHFWPDEGAGGGGEGAAGDPAGGTGGTEPGGAQENWEDRYKEAQGWGTRLAQENATLRTDAELAAMLRDPGKRAEALQQLGLSLIADEDDDGQGDDDGQLYSTDPRLAAELQELREWRQQMEAERQQTTEQQQEQANYQEYRQKVDPALTEMGVPEALHQVIAEAALERPGVHTPQGMEPDLQGAWQQFLQFTEALDDVPDIRNRQLKKYGQTKPGMIPTAQSGRAGTGVPNWGEMSEGDIDAYMASRVIAEQQ